MIKKISLLSFIFCTLSIFAQKDLKIGYVVLETKDTIVGTLKNKNYYSKSAVKLYQENDITRFSKRALSEIHIENDAYIKSDLTIWSQGFFKKVLIGNVNLYTYKRAKLLGGFDSDIGFGRLAPAIRFYCSDYPNLTDSIRDINKENVADFIQTYNDWKLKNPESNSFFEDNIHTKPKINFKMSFLLPGAGFEFVLNDKFSINTMLKNEFGYSSTGGWDINPFIDTQLRYYHNMDKRKAENKRTYKYSGNYVCLMDGYFPKNKSNLIGIEYGWQRMVNKHWYSNLGIGAGKYTTGNQSFAIIYDLDFGYNF
ncbi:hypothetical protein [Mariniflexile fucanivorans]|nr:hypothetical protein [Mariniflexile fucanivorans]